MTETTDREELLRKIVDLELRMFLAVQPSIPSACQEMPDTFKLMRRASFLVLSDETLRCYLADLEEAMDEGQNLMELKYARIDDMIPRLNDSPTIERIVEVEGRWMDELAEEYPLTFQGRSDYAAGVYLRSELETYSAKTLDSYFRDVAEAMGAGRNLTEERYTFIFKESGYDSIGDVEKERTQAQQS